LNDVIEKKNYHLLDIAQTLMVHMHVPKCIWANVVLTASHLINRVISSILYRKTQFLVLYP